MFFEFINILIILFYKISGYTVCRSYWRGAQHLMSVIKHYQVVGKVTLMSPSTENYKISFELQK